MTKHELRWHNFCSRLRRIRRDVRVMWRAKPLCLAVPAFGLIVVGIIDFFNVNAGIPGSFRIGGLWFVLSGLLGTLASPYDRSMIFPAAVVTCASVYALSLESAFRFAGEGVLLPARAALPLALLLLCMWALGLWIADRLSFRSQKKKETHR